MALNVRQKMRAILLGITTTFLFTPELVALSEEEYRAKYAFPVEEVPVSTAIHPDGDFQVVAKCFVRECDADNGDVIILEFHKGNEVIRFYSLKELFPDPDTWDFHRATGVFVWTMPTPKNNGFHGDTYFVLTVAGIRSFKGATGEPVETSQAEQDEALKP